MFIKIHVARPSPTLSQQYLHQHTPTVRGIYDRLSIAEMQHTPGDGTSVDHDTREIRKVHENYLRVYADYMKRMYPASTVQPDSRALAVKGKTVEAVISRRMSRRDASGAAVQTPATPLPS